MRTVGKFLLEFLFLLCGCVVFQFSLVSSCIPRYFAAVLFGTQGISSLCMVNCGGVIGCLSVNVFACVLFGFILILQFFAQVLNMSRSSCKLFLAVLISSCFVKIRVSSA